MLLSTSVNSLPPLTFTDQRVCLPSPSVLEEFMSGSFYLPSGTSDDEISNQLYTNSVLKLKTNKPIVYIPFIIIDASDWRKVAPSFFNSTKTQTHPTQDRKSVV